VFHLKACWVPKSEKGRTVARYLRAQGLEMTDGETVGHYAMAWPCWRELTHDQKRHIAYILDAEGACADEERAYEMAQDMLDDPEGYGVLPQDAERAAERARCTWVD